MFVLSKGNPVPGQSGLEKIESSLFDKELFPVF